MAAISATSTASSTPEDRARAAEVEARAVALSSKVRCLECGHQSIEESGADIAVLLRKVSRVRRRCRHGLGRGESEAYVQWSLKQKTSLHYGNLKNLQYYF